MPLHQSSRQPAKSISESVAKLFAKTRNKTSSELIDRLEEPEIPQVSAAINASLPDSLCGQELSGQQICSLSFYAGPAKRGTIEPDRSQSSTFSRSALGLQNSRRSSSPDSLTLADYTRHKALLKAQSLLGTSERPDLPFLRYSLPLNHEAGVVTRLLPPLNQEFPSLAEIQTIKTIGDYPLINPSCLNVLLQFFLLP